MPRNIKKTTSIIDSNAYIRKLCEMEELINAQTNKYEIQYLNMALKDTDNILQRYTMVKKEGKFKITYRKKIPCRYWHSLYNYYCDYKKAYDDDIVLNRDKIKLMELYIKLIPSLICIQKVRKYPYFSKWRQIYYDHIKKFDNEHYDD